VFEVKINLAIPQQYTKEGHHNTVIRLLKSLTAFRASSPV